MIAASNHCTTRDLVWRTHWLRLPDNDGLHTRWLSQRRRLLRLLLRGRLPCCEEGRVSALEEAWVARLGLALLGVDYFFLDKVAESCDL